MAKEETETISSGRAVVFESVFDRIAHRKLVRAFGTLVPENMLLTGRRRADADNGCLRSGVVGRTEKRSDDRESDSSVDVSRRKTGSCGSG